MSFAFFGFTLLGMVLVYWWKQLRSEDQQNSGKFLRWVFILYSLFFGLWAIRGLIWNGYLLSSLGLGGVPVEWQTPIDLILARRRGIASFARSPFLPVKLPDEVLGDRQWVLPWVRDVAMFRGFFPVLVPFLITLSIWCLYWLGKIIGRKPQSELGTVKILMVPFLANGLFWFFSAPLPRFAGYTFWGLAGLSICLLADHFAEGSPKGFNFGVLIFAVALTVINLPLYPSMNLQIKNLNFADGPTREFVTDSGLVILVPEKGDQCWDATLPCTPNPSSRLRLRTDGDLADGFILEKPAEQ